jgi:hypothetical protein
MKRARKKSASDLDSVAVAAAVAAATDTEIPKGEDLLPPELAKKYLAAKAKLRRKPSGK